MNDETNIYVTSVGISILTRHCNLYVILLMIVIVEQG